MQNKVLNGHVYEICIGKFEAQFLCNVRRLFERLRAKNVAANLKKTKLDLPEVEYVLSSRLHDRHLVHPREAIEGP